MLPRARPCIASWRLYAIIIQIKAADIDFGIKHRLLLTKMMVANSNLHCVWHA